MRLAFFKLWMQDWEINLVRDILITHELIQSPMTKKDLDNVVEAFKKVYKLRQTTL